MFHILMIWVFPGCWRCGCSLWGLPPMSGYGIQLINDYGLTVADAEDVNYVLRSAGQFSNGHFISGGNTTSAISLITTGMNSPLSVSEDEYK